MKADTYRRDANLYLRFLASAARHGDPAAIQELHKFCRCAVDRLREAEICHPDAVRPLKRASSRWPGYHTPIAMLKKMEEPFAKDVGLDTLYKASGKQSDPDLPASFAGWNILATVEAFRWRRGERNGYISAEYRPVKKLSKGLPPLSRGTITVWKPVLEAAFDAEFGECETNKLFKPLVAEAERKSASEQKKVNVESFIKKRVMQSISSILS